MENPINTLVNNPAMALGVAVFLSAVALFYLVIQRTRKHRLEQALDRET